MFLVVSWLVQVVLILLAVAFFTLFERNVIGLFHNRLGPNNVSILGLLQPLLDAFNLLSNQNLTPYRANNFSYNAAPVIALFISLFVWICLPSSFYSAFHINFSFIIFFLIGSVIVFAVLVSGWSSNSKYSLIGSLRSVAQSISYESVFSSLLILIIVFLSSYSISSCYEISNCLVIFIFPLWVICTLAETHRAPFDFSESESELVSGFNTEYSGTYFALIFLSEYSILLFSCVLMVYLFFSPFIFLDFWFIVVFISLFVSFFFIWIRVTFCRFRYDLLMGAAWKSLLPTTLSLIVFYFSCSVLF